jgi:plastocyanin
MRKSLVLSACLLATHFPAGSAFAQDAPEVISVELSNFKFSPDQLTLQHGHAYRLHLVNEAGGAHDFMAAEFFAASKVAAADSGSVVDGKIKLAGHQTVDVTLTPEKAGTYELHCSHFMHSGMGMKGQIIVQ